MGIINVASGCVASFYGAGHMKPGGISLIAHSGSVFTTLAMNDPRFRFDVLASPGQEIGATIDEYIDFALNRATTKVVAVFIEAARNPDGFVASLRRARDVGVPVVICKVGRSEESARMAHSHTGALVGSKVAYDAVIDECGAISVDTVDQLMNVALLCSTGRLPGSGGVGLVTDSGGLRELAMDLAAENKTALARLSSATMARLRAVMPEKLDPSNPLDCAADLTEDYAKTFEEGVDILARADEISMIGFEADLRDDYIYDAKLMTLAADLANRTSKPCFFYSSFSRAHNRRLGGTLIENGVPCINGLGEMLTAVTCLQDWADARRKQPHEAPVAAPDAVVAQWKSRLDEMARVDEHSALSMLSDFGVPSVGGEIHDTWETLKEAAARFGYPVVLKTAAPGVEHKSDLGGVYLDLADEEALCRAYAELSHKLGSRALVQPLAGKGIELALGASMMRISAPSLWWRPAGCWSNTSQTSNLHSRPSPKNGRWR